MADPWAVVSTQPIAAAPPAAVAPAASGWDVASVTGAPSPTPAQPQPSLGERIWNGLKQGAAEVGDFINRADQYKDTRVAETAGGIAGIPRATADIANWAANKVGLSPSHLTGLPIIGPAIGLASQLPTGSDIRDKILDQGKAIPGFKPRSINPVVDAGVDAVLGGGAGGRLGPFINFGAGAGSEGAGGIAHEYFPDYEVPARVLGAVAGGAGLGGAAAVARSAPGRVAAAIKPFTAAGRDELVGSVLRKTAADPDAAVARMEGYTAGREAFPEAVPGFKIDAGKASRDPGLMQLSEVAAANNPAMRAAYNTNNAAITGTLDRVSAGLPPASETGNIIQSVLDKRFTDLMAARKAASDPLYTEARNSTTPVNPWPLMTSTADLAAATKDAPKALVNRVRGLLFTPEGPADRTAAGMMATRSAINDLLDNRELPNFQRSLLQGFKKQADDILSVVPEEQQARQTFAKLSKPLEPFNADLGNKAVAEVVARDPYGKQLLMPGAKVPGQFVKPGAMSAPAMQKFMAANGGNPQGIAAMRSYLINDFRDAATSSVAQDAAGNPRLTANGAATWLDKNRAGAANVLTPEQLGAMDEISKHLTDQAQTVPGRVGSPTYDRLATESIIGGLLHPTLNKLPVFHALKKGLGLLAGGADEAIRNRLFEVIADPNAAKALMRKATPQNVKLAEPVLAKLSAATTLAASRPTADQYPGKTSP